MSSGSKRAKVGFIHTTPSTIGMVENYMKENLPDTEIVHIYDGNVKIDNFNSPIGITPKSNLLRYSVFGDQLEKAGCSVVVSCCSLMPRATLHAKKVVDVPFIQLDGVILDRVVEQYSRIGVINTTPYSVPYIEEGLKKRADKLNKEIKLKFSNSNTALDFFNQGNFDEHDRIVINAVKKLAGEGLDCILMGQIPFGLMDEKLKNLALNIPILYAGFEAFQRIKELIEN